MKTKWLVSIGYAIAIILIIIYQNPILRWLNDDGTVNLALLFGAAVLLALVPVVPYAVVAGVLGAKYGPVLGGLVNVASSTAAAALLFLTVRLAFREQANRHLAKFKRMERFTALMERNAFLAVLAARLIPFVPAVAVNVYSGICQMRFGAFISATLIGKIPVMFMFAVIGDQLFSDWRNMGWTLAIYAIFICVVYLIYRFYRKRQAVNPR